MWQKAQHLAALLIEKKANILKEEEEISESCFPSKKTHLFCQLSSWNYFCYVYIWKPETRTVWKFNKEGGILTKECIKTYFSQRYASSHEVFFFVCLLLICLLLGKLFKSADRLKHGGEKKKFK